MTNLIVLSVRLMTYNHADYIIQCLDCIENQKTNFAFEVIIGDDFSTDNNITLINQFIKSSTNNNINYILLDRKKGDDYDMNRQKKGRLYNFLDIINHCKGKYIALIDGDDYWTDPYKLQKQVDFLEANSEYVLCFTNTKIKTRTSLVVNNLIVPKNYENIETLAYIGNYIHTPTVVFKNIIKEFPNQFNTSPIGDYFIYMLLAEKGKIYFIDEYTTVYRKHVGTFSSLDDNVQYQKMTTCRAQLYGYFNDKNNTKITEILKNKIVQYFRDTDKIFTVNEIKNITKNDNLTLAIYEYFYIFCKKKNFIKSISSKDLVKIFIHRLLKKIKIKK